MKPGLIIVLAIAGAVTIAGSIILGIGLSNGGFGGEKINKESEIDESFTNIDMNLSVSEVTFKKSSDDKCKVEVIEKERLYHKVEVKDDTLNIRMVDELKFYEKMFGYNGLKLTVHLPLNTYNNLKFEDSTGNLNFEDSFTFEKANVKCTTGDIHLKDLTINSNLDINTSTGKIYLTNVNIATDLKIIVTTGDVYLNHVACDSASLESSTGQMIFDNLLVTNHLKVKASTGDVRFNQSDAGTIEVKTSTGDVTGNLLTDKTFNVKTTTGKKQVPSTSGPLCKIETTTGDIIIEIKPAN